MNLDLIRLNKCPCCSRKIDLPPVYRLKRFDVFDCPECKVRFIDPSLTAEQQMLIYQDSATLREINPACENYYEYDTLRPGSRTYRDYVNALTRCEQLTQGRTLLEAGCGKGSFLKLAQARGWDVSGIDSSVENTNFLKEQGIRAICGNLFTYTPDRPYDVIVLWDVLEHPQDPGGLLQKCRQWLAEGGLLLVACPCYPNLLSVIADLIFRLSGGSVRGPLKSMYMLEHTCYFSPSSLSRLLNNAGFYRAACWKTETDLARYKFNVLTRTALELSFLAGRFLALQNRLMSIAKCI